MSFLFIYIHQVPRLVNNGLYPVKTPAENVDPNFSHCNLSMDNSK